MNPFVTKLINENFMTAEQGEYLAAAIAAKDNIIISGHRGHGILNLLAAMGAVAKESHKMKPVRNIETDIKDPEAVYYLIGDLKDVDYPAFLTRLLASEEASIITMKDAEHSFSVMKVLSDVYKANAEAAKTYQLIECTKDADGLKHIAKIVKAVQNKEGKLVRTTVF